MVLTGYWYLCMTINLNHMYVQHEHADTIPFTKLDVSIDKAYDVFTEGIWPDSWMQNRLRIFVVFLSPLSKYRFRISIWTITASFHRSISFIFPFRFYYSTLYSANDTVAKNSKYLICYWFVKCFVFGSLSHDKIYLFWIRLFKELKESWF